MKQIIQLMKDKGSVMRQIIVIAGLPPCHYIPVWQMFLFVQLLVFRAKPTINSVKYVKTLYGKVPGGKFTSC